ncbi:hypothetical protein GMRT_11926 [Giardia muris]|uniref:Uncharacterized protein n=1 Tax=Giardia muris TaxID=5742 RepID=A0A4Z1SS00_GIAMU|nr:hypothetical protein GMRT_11926 [Giardia muris]|eukprot:TNJ28540.1 hypothetical protein GMRT_11926 [Giardia muris]
MNWPHQAATSRQAADVLSSTSEISYAAGPRSSVRPEFSDLAQSLLSSATRSEPHRQALLRELEANCKTVNGLVDCISKENQTMSRFLEQTQRTLTLSTSGLGERQPRRASGRESPTPRVVLPSVTEYREPDSSLQIKTSTSVQDGLRSLHSVLDRQANIVSRISMSLSDIAQTPTRQPGYDTSSLFLSGAALQHDTPLPNPSQPSSLRTQYGSTDRSTTQPDHGSLPNQQDGPTPRLSGSKRAEPLTASTAQANATPDGTCMVHPSTSLQAGGRLRPNLRSSLPEAASLTVPTIGHGPGKTVTAETLGMKDGGVAIKDYASLFTPETMGHHNGIVFLDNPPVMAPFASGLTGHEPTDLYRLKHEVDSVRRYMNINLTARDAELERLSSEVRSLKNRSRPQSAESTHAQHAARPIRERPRSAPYKAQDGLFADTHSRPALSSESITDGIITPQGIESYFSTEPSSTLGESVSVIQLDPPPVVELIKEYNTGTFNALKEELRRTKEEADMALREKNEEIAALRERLFTMSRLTEATSRPHISFSPSITVSQTGQDPELGATLSSSVVNTLTSGVQRVTFAVGTKRDDALQTSVSTIGSSAQLKVSRGHSPYLEGTASDSHANVSTHTRASATYTVSEVGASATEPSRLNLTDRINALKAYSSFGTEGGQSSADHEKGGNVATLEDFEADLPSPSVSKSASPAPPTQSMPALYVTSALPPAIIPKPYTALPASNGHREKGYSSISTPSTVSVNEMYDTGDARDDEFLSLEREVRMTQSQLVQSLVGTLRSSGLGSTASSDLVASALAAAKQ